MQIQVRSKYPPNLNQALSSIRERKEWYKELTMEEENGGGRG
jgi:hypothetical protein